MTKSTTVQAPRLTEAHFELDETLIQLNALLEMSVMLHHYGSLPDGCHLSEQGVAGLIAMQHELKTQSQIQLTGTFANIRQLTIRN